MDFLSLKDRIGEFAANEMKHVEKQTKKFDDACKAGNIQIVKNMFITDNFSPGDALIRSCKHGNLKFFGKLVNTINTVNFSNEEFQECLNNACENNYPQLVKYIIVTINTEFDYSKINYKNLDILLAIESCTDISPKIDYKKCLFDASSSNDQPLFDYSFNKLCEPLDTQTIQKIMNTACFVSDPCIDFIKHLLQKIYTCNEVPTDVYNSGLLSACEIGNLELVEWLLEKHPTNINECLNEIRCNLYDEIYVTIYNLLKYIKDNGYSESEYDPDSDSEND
jgi:hypothetical protein